MLADVIAGIVVFVHLKFVLCVVCFLVTDVVLLFLLKTEVIENILFVL